MADPPPNPAVSGAGNRLLSRLPDNVLAALTPRLAPVSLAHGQVLYAADDAIKAAYFPLSGLLSMIAQLEDGTQVEVGLVGADGVAGTALVAGGDIASVECAVQLAGTALSMDAAAFRAAANTLPEFRVAVSRHREVLLLQAMQSAPCYARHDLPQRLARWLLMAHDRVGNGEMTLTQDFLASMLGAHRPNVSPAAGVLQRAGAIGYQYGRVRVLDRAALEGCACECYAAVRRRSERILGAVDGRT